MTDDFIYRLIDSIKVYYYIIYDNMLYLYIFIYNPSQSK